MMEDMGLSKSTQGLLVALGYVGIIVGSVFSGVLLEMFSAKRLLQASLVIVAVGVAGFAAAPIVLVMYITRPIIGFGQALITVLYPCWVDEFAPSGSASAYMAALQAGGPLGTVVGYLTSGFLMANTDLSWRWCFIIQGIFLGPFVLLYFLIPTRYIEIRNGDGSRPSANQLKRGLFHVASEGLVWFAALTLSSLYFVVNGIQTWITDYITSPDGPIGANQNTAVAAFGATAATAPVAGIILGGIILVKVGGYKGHLDRVSQTGLALGFMATAFSFASMFVDVFTAFIACVWLLLFFGGAMVPGLMGTIVAAVPKEHRGICSAFASVIYNTFGYALGPLVGGIIADEAGLIWGFRVILGCSGAALLLQCAVVYFAVKKVDRVAEQFREEERLEATLKLGNGGDAEDGENPNPLPRRHTYGTAGDSCAQLKELHVSMQLSTDPQELDVLSRNSMLHFSPATYAELSTARKKRYTMI
eukprot:TRINITY_DN20213_c1_g1_i1.p1 TRINITY_DN20213_c1_g1~~TRINITY_DN20213_c1_g1_i1.p1  ORF type:complete len:544 (+),score=94.80 TRINITY_DN20213_c1_g1_i1:209-1633(+)